jgi:hypothetical protein
MAEFFNSNSKDKNNVGATRFADGSDMYANQKNLKLHIKHVASGKDVNFKAFITAYNENFQASYQSEQVFGRFDPIMTYQNTRRSFTVSWEIPAYSLVEAIDNLTKCNRLAQFMYPAYEQGNRANTLSKPPLMRIKFANLIRNAATNEGLLVAVGGLTINPDWSADGSGFFDPGTGTLYPKLITIDFSDITVLHEHQIGWGEELGFNEDEYKRYPFGKTGLQPVPSGPPTPGETVATLASTPVGQAPAQDPASNPGSSLPPTDGGELNGGAAANQQFNPLARQPISGLRGEAYTYFAQANMYSEDIYDEEEEMGQFYGE